MNEDGQIIAPKEDPNLSQEKVVAMCVDVRFALIRLLFLTIAVGTAA